MDVDPAALAPEVLATAESVVIANLSPLASRQSLFVGDRGVTKETGFEIQFQKSYSFDLEVNKPLFAVADSTQGTSVVPVMVLETLPRDVNHVPMNIDLASNLGGEVIFVHSALQAQTVLDLPVNPAKGLMAQIQIGTWPDIEVLELTCFEDPVSHQKFWMSDSGSLITQMDQGYMGSNTSAVPDYVDTTVAGGTSGLIGWTTRAIRRVSEILATGLKLQTNMTGIVGGPSGGGQSFTLYPFWFQHNNSDLVVFSADGSTRDAESAPLISNADNLVRFKSTGWNDVYQRATTLQVTSASINKANLWPRLYGQVSAGIQYGQEIDIDLVYRWYVPAVLA